MSSRNRMPRSTSRQVRRADEVRDHREVAAPQRPLAVEIADRRARTRSRTGRCRAAPAMVERERRRRRRAEIVCGHRAGERRHPGVRQRRELERREVAVAEPALAATRQAPRSRCDRGGATSRSRRARRSPASTRGSPAIRTTAASRSSSVAEKRCQRVVQRRIDDDAMTERREPRHRALERRRARDETRRRVQADAVGRRIIGGRHRRAAKKSDRSSPHSPARTPPVTDAW